MAEYKEFDLLKMAIEAEPYFTDSTKAAFRNIVNKVPAADVVPVVRCKDCKFCVFHSGADWCIRWRTFPCVKPDDFCSYGEKRRAE